ncbi:MAG TPA: LuxR C-terminal-related transcriptional regulator [Acetobacteraceae bacterium]|nr:LuxR C-terminal-related transcriptional regulator [Acetobacteraceae bacterium]
MAPHAVLPKTLAAEEWTRVVTWVMEGGIYVPSSIADLPPDEFEGHPATTPARAAGFAPDHHGRPVAANGSRGGQARPGDLTPRQNAVLALLVAGKSNRESARALQLSEGTVKLHIAAVFRILSVNNRASAAVAGTRLLAREGEAALRGM